MSRRPPTGQELLRTGASAVVVVVVLALLLVLTPVLSLRQAVPLLVGYVLAVSVVTLARWLQARAGRG